MSAVSNLRAGAHLFPEPDLQQSDMPTSLDVRKPHVRNRHNVRRNTDLLLRSDVHIVLPHVLLP